MNTLSLDPHTHASGSLFRGSSYVLEQALLAQTCRVLLAASVLAEVEETQLHQDVAQPHLWRVEPAKPTDVSLAGGSALASTTGVYRVDHVLNALGIRRDDVLSQEHSVHHHHKGSLDRSMSHSAAAGHTQQPTTGMTTASVNVVESSAVLSVAEARRCLQDSPQCAILTALHMMLCTSPCIAYCRHGDGSLVRRVQDQLFEEPEQPPRRSVDEEPARHDTSASTSTQHSRRRKDVARLLARYAFARWHQAQGASDTHGTPRRTIVEQVDLASRTDVFLHSDGDVSRFFGCVSPPFDSDASPTVTPQHPRVPRVYVKEAIEYVFPELASPSTVSISMACDGSTAVHCGCPHVWFRQCVPRWLLEVAQEEHAIVWCDSQRLADALRRWRRRRGRRILSRLTQQLDDGVDVTLDVPPRRGASRPFTVSDARPRSQCSSICGHSSTSAPSLPSAQVLPLDTQPPPEHKASSTAGVLASPTRRACTQSPLRDELVACHDEGADDQAQDETNNLSAREHSAAAALPATEQTPERHTHVAATADGLVASPAPIAPPPLPTARSLVLREHGGVCEGDVLEADCLRRRHLLHMAFMYWRDVRFYQRLATAYISKLDDAARRRASWQVWRKRVVQRQRLRKQQEDDTLCERYLREKAQPLRATVLRNWRDAVQSRCFQWRHVGRRVFHIWVRQATLRQVLREKETVAVVQDAPRQCARVWDAWLGAFRGRVADRHRRTHMAVTIIALLRRRLAHSGSSAALLALQDAQRQRGTSFLFAQWRRRAQLCALERRYAMLRTLRQYHTVMNVWQQAVLCRVQIRASTARAEQRHVRVCFMQWQRRFQHVHDASQVHATRDHDASRRLFQHWRQRVQWRQKHWADLEEVAGRLAPSLHARAVLRRWLARTVETRREKELDARHVLERAADAHRQLHMTARAFYHWRAQLFLLQRCSMDTRRALPSAAILPSARKPRDHLVTVDAKHKAAARPRQATSKRAKPQPASSIDDGCDLIVVRSAPAESHFTLRNQKPNTQTTVRKSASHAALQTEMCLWRAQREGCFGAARSPAIVDHPVCLPQRQEQPHPSPPVTPSSLSEQTISLGMQSSPPAVANVVTALPPPKQRLRKSDPFLPDGLNESHSSPARSRPHAQISPTSSRQSGGWAMVSKNAPRGTLTTVKSSLHRPRDGLSAPGVARTAPRYMQPTQASKSHGSANAPSFAATPEKQVFHRASTVRAQGDDAAFPSVGQDEALPTPIAADSLLMTSLASDGLTVW